MHTRCYINTLATLLPEKETQFPLVRTLLGPNTGCPYHNFTEIPWCLSISDASGWEKTWISGPAERVFVVLWSWGQGLTLPQNTVLYSLFKIIFNTRQWVKSVKKIIPNSYVHFNRNLCNCLMIWCHHCFISPTVPALYLTYSLAAAFIEHEL